MIIRIQFDQRYTDGRKVWNVGDVEEVDSKKGMAKSVLRFGQAHEVPAETPLYHFDSLKREIGARHEEIVDQKTGRKRFVPVEIPPPPGFVESPVKTEVVPPPPDHPPVATPASVETADAAASEEAAASQSDEDRLAELQSLSKPEIVRIATELKDSGAAIVFETSMRKAEIAERIVAAESAG